MAASALRDTAPVHILYDNVVRRPKNVLQNMTRSFVVVKNADPNLIKE